MNCKAAGHAANKKKGPKPPNVKGLCKPKGKMANRVPCQPLLAFALTFAFACTTRLTAAAQENRPGSEDGLLEKLEGMRIKEPGAVRSALHSLGLELSEDFEILSDGEREEMLSGLAGEGISLGDRSKVRHDFDDLQAGEGRASTKTKEGLKVDRERNTYSKGGALGAAPRRVQDATCTESGGGVSSDSIALMATAALGILSFIVQARVSSNEHKKHADLDREHAGRDKEQMRAGQLLARVQLQIAEFIDPAMISVTAASGSWMYINYAVGLHGYIAQYEIELISQPAPPHAKTLYYASPKMWRALAAAPYIVVHDADIEMLQGDAAKRQLYAELVEATYVPPLRAFCDVVATKSHLAPWFDPARLDKMLPGLGQSWAAKASLLNIFNELAIWTQQFDAVLARMKAGDNSLLAPTIPTPIAAVMMAVTMMKTAVSKKELALLGAS